MRAISAFTVSRKFLVMPPISVSLGGGQSLYVSLLQGKFVHCNLRYCLSCLCTSTTAIRSPLVSSCVVLLWVVAATTPSSATTFLRWTQSNGIGMDSGAMQINGSYVNQYDEGTELGTVLSEGTVEQIREGAVEQTVDYQVTLYRANDLFYKEADDLTNNAFVLHANGQADWYSSIKGSGTAALQFDFYNRDTAFTVEEAVALSFTSPHVQPDTVDPAASEVKRLHYNEVYDLQVLGASGLLLRTFTDPHNQLQQGILAGTMPDGSAADFSLGWAEAGFGNDLNTDGNLDVGEALFTYDLTPAESFLISRDGDNGKRSAMGFTAEGFFGGTNELTTVPEPAAILLALLGLALLPRRRGR